MMARWEGGGSGKGSRVTHRSRDEEGCLCCRTIECMGSKLKSKIKTLKTIKTYICSNKIKLNQISLESCTKHNFCYLSFSFCVEIHQNA